MQRIENEFEVMGYPFQTLKTVLIVDDSLYMRMFLQQTFEKAGFRVVGTAATGEQAMDMAFALHPNVITLDNILPDMMGTDILKVFRDEGLESSVIMISAVGQELVIKEGLALGAKAYLVKPFTEDDVQRLLIKLKYAE